MSWSPLGVVLMSAEFFVRAAGLRPGITASARLSAYFYNTEAPVRGRTQGVKIQVPVRGPVITLKARNLLFLRG